MSPNVEEYRQSIPTSTLRSSAKSGHHVIAGFIAEERRSGPSSSAYATEAGEGRRAEWAASGAPTPRRGALGDGVRLFRD